LVTHDLIGINSNILALAPGTLEGTILPPQRMDVGLTLVDVEELVDV
jgi:hypothetical protein